MTSLIAVAFVLVAANLACAGERDDALKVLSVLRQIAAGEKSADEMRSIDATFSTAEEFLLHNDSETASRYYLLTIQKARVLLANQMDSTASTPVSCPSQPQNVLHASVPLSNAEAMPPAQISESEPRENRSSLPASTPAQGMQASPPMIIGAEAEYPSDEITSEKLVGNVNSYTVVKNDTLRLVAAKLGVSRQHLARMNHLDTKAPLMVGKSLKYNNRKIIPQRMKNGIVINIPDRTLYYFKQGKLAVSLPVAVGTPRKSEKYDWKTPTGKFKITAKQKDPTWHVPSSIQSEMEEEGKEIITSIPPGPDNPLGKYAIKTSLPGIMIHSTSKPGSIYSFASHGCIRVSPQRMEEFFKEIKVNTHGEIIYRPVKLAVTEEGRIFMEVHQDAYGKGSGLDVEAKQMIRKHNLSDRVDWKKVESVVRHKDGIAEDITL